MSRKISKRLKIKGKVTAQTALHVGGLGTDLTIDLSLAVNGRNEIYIPGTSIAGAFRNWMWEQEQEQEQGFGNVDQFWGFQKEDKGHASFVMIEDAVVTLPEGAIAEVRDHVGIDRVWGAASDKTKFDREVFPRGSSFMLKMTVDITSRNESELPSIERLINALEQGELRLGAAKTRGLGRVKLSDVSWLEQDFSSFDGMIAVLNQSGQEYIPQATVMSDLLRLSIHWQPIAPVMVKSGQDGVAVDILPLTSRDGDLVRFMLPGSAVKGALRSQAERILRTILQLECAAGSDVTLQSQIEDPALELAQWLFGMPGTGDVTQQIGLGRGALMVDDCYCQKQLDPQKWQRITQMTDEPNSVNASNSVNTSNSLNTSKSADPPKAMTEADSLQAYLNEAGLQDTQQAFHVAIDRWTGGAADAMLYTALEPMNLQWEPIELTIDLRRIVPHYRQPVQALLLLLLRDLASGRIPLGYGVNRGYGTLAIEKVACVSPALEGWDGQVITFGEGAIAGLDLTELNQAWQAWIQQAHTDLLQSSLQQSSLEQSQEDAA
jgi:CRISPR/Cas system CSM-associated protein Csm3 (group 7 of RAMP superfamily)